MYADHADVARLAPRFTLYGGPDSRDRVWIITLGVAARQHLTVDAACNAVWEIADFKWTPTRDFLVSCIQDMVRNGGLALVGETGGGDLLATTLKGRKTLRHLLAAPLDGTGGMANQFAISLKLAFLDLLPPADRPVLVDALISVHERDLNRRKADLRLLWVGPHGREWLDREGERLQRDLGRLRKIRAALGCGRACPGCSCAPTRH